MNFFNCEICAKKFPMSLHHEHHKIPKSLGGSDEKSNLADLCSSCHQHLHAVAFMIVNPNRRQEIEPTLIAIFGADQDARRRMLQFSQMVAKEMILRKEIRKEQSQELRTVVELPSRYVELLRLSGYDQPHASGRKAGVSRVIRKIVAEFLIRKFPAHRIELTALFKPTKQVK